MSHHMRIQNQILGICLIFLVGMIGLYPLVFCAAGAFADIAPNVIKNPHIERIIPSKESDLFVVLKNGLTVLIRENLASDVVASQVLVKTGSIYEGDRMGGGLFYQLGWRFRGSRSPAPRPSIRSWPSVC